MADRVELIKQYNGRGATGQFVYVGVCVTACSPATGIRRCGRGFCGVFWLARSDRLDDATRTALDARVRSHSVRKDLVLAALAAMLVALFIGLVGYPRIALAVAFVFLAFRFVLVDRTDAMRREALLWKRELG